MTSTTAPQLKQKIGGWTATLGREGNMELWNSYYLDWEMETGFVPFLLCDLENPTFFMLQLSHLYNRDSNDFSTSLGGD